MLQWEKELRITFKTFVLKYTTRLPQIYTTINSHRAIMVKRFCAFVCLAFNYYTFYALYNFLANRYIETIRERFCVCKNMLIKYNMNRNPVTKYNQSVGKIFLNIISRHFFNIIGIESAKYSYWKSNRCQTYRCCRGKSHFNMHPSIY